MTKISRLLINLFITLVIFTSLVEVVCTSFNKETFRAHKFTKTKQSRVETVSKPKYKVKEKLILVWVDKESEKEVIRITPVSNKSVSFIRNCFNLL